MNKGTIKDNYLISLILDLIDTMSIQKVFTKIDLRWGYNNVRIKEGDEWKTAFTTHLGIYEPTVMFFGLTNLPATFQAIINNILRDIINTGDIAALIDSVLVETEDEKGHDEIVKEVLRRIEANDLYIKPEKCIWKVKKINFLGLVMGEGGIKMQEEKVAGVLEQPMPKMIKDVQKFLGLANYYRQFVKDFAKIAKPMHQLVRKDEKWSWGEEQETVFKQLKKVFTTQSVLVAPDLDREMWVETNVSEYMIEGVLSMKYEDNKWRLVAFISKLLNEAERNYEIHNRKILAII